MEQTTETGGRILLVDDEAAILRTFRYCLEDRGYTVMTAASAAQAEAILQRQVFDVCSTCAWAKTTVSTCCRSCARWHPGCGW
jgi:DNA-binding NtrC family response regulator